MRRLVLAAGIVLAVAAHAQEPSRYTNAQWRWSISYPAGWTVDGRDPSAVRVRPAAGDGLCTILSGPMDRFNNVDEFTDFLLRDNEAVLKTRGLKFTVLARRKITLPGNIVANDVLADVGAIRSRRLYVLADGRGFAVDCESNAKSWSGLEVSYRRILDSFTVGK